MVLLKRKDSKTADYLVTLKAISSASSMVLLKKKDSKTAD